MWDVAKIIQKDIFKEKWKFNGYLNNFTALQLLSTFLKWVLIGQKIETAKELIRAKLKERWPSLLS